MINGKDDYFTTSQLSKELGFNVSIDFLETRGISPALKTKLGAYWHRDDYPAICCAIASYLSLKAGMWHFDKKAAKPRQET